jgi:hypothetical protein
LVLSRVYANVEIKFINSPPGPLSLEREGVLRYFVQNILALTGYKIEKTGLIDIETLFVPSPPLFLKRGGLEFGD